MSISYRPDIDGLRAVAVLSVIFFHTDMPLFSGGFVGVDLFFVISGFLITSIIVGEVEINNFSILRFYERRIRRIIPALVPVMLFTAAAGYYWLYPRLFEQFGDSIVSTVFFVSNILFWHEAGYFDAPALQKPLLHTWSLAVEEQFYLFYPVFLLMIKRFFNGKYKQWLLIATAASFIVSVYTVLYKPSIAFYWFPPRAWELLVGGLLALEVFPEVTGQKARHIISVTGLLLVIYSIVFFTEKTMFPGHMALFPVLGSGLLIYAGKSGEHIIGNILKNRFFVLTGLLSYSMYLWHWPLIVFSKYVLMRELYLPETFVLIVCVFIISYLSWRFFERPFRGKSSVVPERKHVFAAAGVVMVIFATAGTVIHFSYGMPERLGLKKNPAAVFEEDKYVTDELKKINTIGSAFKLGDVDTEPVYLLWGDSHAGSLAPGIFSLSNKYGKCGLVFTGPGVPPLLHAGGGDYVNTDATEFNENVFRYIENHPEINTVILSARWYVYSKNDWFERCTVNTVERLLKLGKKVVIDHPEINTVILSARWYVYSKNDWFERCTVNTVERLLKLGKKVVIVDEVPKLVNNPQQAYSVAYRNSENVDGFAGMADSAGRGSDDKVFVGIINRFKKIKNFTVVYPEEMLMSDDKVVLIKQRRLLYDDDNHLSQTGSLYIMPLFEVIIKSS